MRTLLMGIVGGLVASVGLASTAKAGAAVDLIWEAGGVNTTIATSSSATLNVILTNDVHNIGASLSIDYSGVAAFYEVVALTNNPGKDIPSHSTYLPLRL